MTRTVELIFDRECPNVDGAREQLRRAFAAVGVTASWIEWDRESPDAPAYVRRYGSPTVLVDGQDVEGVETESEAACCRVYAGGDGGFGGVPILAKIVDALQRSGD